jgi:glycerol-3-phosphate acyltransferase PlsY
MVIIWNILKFATNYVSLASMITGIIAAVIFFVKYGLTTQSFVLFAASLYVIFRHRSNIERLINGTENKIRKE